MKDVIKEEKGFVEVLCFRLFYGVFKGTVFVSPWRTGNYS